MAPHSSTLAWKTPWTEEPGRLQSMGSLSQTRLSNFTFTFHFHALEKEMATHSSVLAWRIPGMGEPGGLQSMGSHRVGYDLSNLAGSINSILKISRLWLRHTPGQEWVPLVPLVVHCWNLRWPPGVHGEGPLSLLWPKCLKNVQKLVLSRFKGLKWFHWEWRELTPISHTKSTPRFDGPRGEGTRKEVGEVQTYI